MNETIIIADPDQYNKWFKFTLLFLVIEYGRPQDILPPLGYLMPGMIAALILTAFIIASGKFKLSYSKQTKMIWLFITLLSIYIPLAVNNYQAYVATHDMILFMPFILSTVICVNSMDRLKKMIFVGICLMAYISAYGFLHQGRGSGNYFGDENDISLYINMWLPFCFFLYSHEKEKLKKLIYLSGMILGVLCIVVSFSRGGFVGLVSTAVISWLFSKKKMISLLIIIVLATVILLFANDAYWDRIASAQDTDEGTAKIRIESWKAGWRMFLDNPLGVGGNNYQVRFPEYQSDFFHRGMWGRVAHSLWFTLIPELGIFGILIYFYLLKYNISDIISLLKLPGSDPDILYLHSLSAAFIASIAGYFISGTFISVLYYPHYWYISGIIVAATRIGNKTLVNAGPTLRR